MPQNQSVTIANLGGNSRTLNITAAAIIKPTPGYLYRLIVVAPGSGSGSVTLNDNTLLTGNTAANTLFTALFSALTVGQVIALEIPCTSGIVVSAVPAGSPIFVLTWS